jgi:hypothetical protein
VTRTEGYRLRKTVGNKTVFAAVTLVISELRKNGPVNVRIDSERHQDEWFNAAAAGVRPVADFIAWNGPKAVGLEIMISKVEASPSDATTDFIECAAGLATWKALAPSSWPEPEVAREGRWVLKYRILPSLSA